MDLQFKVSGQQLSLSPSPMVVADSRGYLNARFAFSGDWANAEKTAVFKAFDGTVYHMALTGGACAVPEEVITAPWFTVSVFGGDRLTANTVTVAVEPSGCEDGITPPEPTPDIYAQLVAEVTAARDAADQSAATAGAEADAAAQQAAHAGSYAGQSADSASAAAESVTNAEAFAIEAGISANQARTSGSAAQTAATEAAESAQEAQQAVSTLPVASMTVSGSFFDSFTPQTKLGYYVVGCATTVTNRPFNIPNSYFLVQYAEANTGATFLLTAQNANRFAYATGIRVENSITWSAWTEVDLSALATTAQLAGKQDVITASTDLTAHSLNAFNSVGVNGSFSNTLMLGGKGVATQEYVNGLVGNINDALEARLGGVS